MVFLFVVFIVAFVMFDCEVLGCMRCIDYCWFWLCILFFDLFLGRLGLI